MKFWGISLRISVSESEAKYIFLVKGLLFDESKNFQDQLSTIEPKNRLDLLVKMLSYVLPEAEAVHYKENEPISFGFDD